MGEDTGMEKDQNPCSILCSKEYYIPESISEIQYRTSVPVNLSSENLLPDVCISGCLPGQRGPHKLSSLPLLEEAQVSSGSSRTSKQRAVPSGETHGCSGSVSFPDSVLDTSICLEKTFEGGNGQKKSLISEVDCQKDNRLGAGSHLTYSPVESTSGSNSVYLNYSTFPMICQSDTQSCEKHKGFGYLVSSLDMLSIPCSRSVLSEDPLALVCQIDGRVASVNNNVDNNEPQDSDICTRTCDSFLNINSTAISSSGIQEHPSAEKYQEKLDSIPTAVEMVCAVPQHYGFCSFSDGKQNIEREYQDLEALFYEPPRFPSLEVPFVSCDLTSSSDLHQAYSPLGIRQLMMSSMNWSSPYKLWDSPSSDDSPDAVLKNAAKSFLCTPSIMKERQYELLSPLQGRRSDKKSTKVTSDELEETSSVNRNDCSSVDAISDENGSCIASFSSTERTMFSTPYYQKKKSEAFPDKKENLVDNNVKDECVISGISNSGKKTDWESHENKKKSGGHTLDGAKDTNADTRSETAGILVGHNINDMQPFSSHDENIDIFMDTPGTKRGIESPSAWQLPWFMSTLLPESKIITDIPFENFGYFMSPCDRSLDAIELMRLLSEPAAAALAEAHEALVCENIQMPLTEGHKESSNGSN